MSIFAILGIVCIVLGLILGIRAICLKKKEKEQKGFIVIAGTILLIYMFPSVGLIILGLVLLAIFGGGCH